MLGYLLRRVLAAIPVMGVVALFVFLLLRLTPGDPAAILAGDNATPEQLERIRISLGLHEPIYVQFFKKSQFKSPTDTFVFLDEQADTLNDGFFVNQLDSYMWGNVPGSYHTGGANFSFADGHLEAHRWLVAGTVQPVRGARINAFPASPPADFEWLKARTSYKKP